MAASSLSGRFWRRGVGHGDLRRRARRSHRFSPGALERIFDSDDCVFSVGSIGASWMAPVRSVVPIGLLAGVISVLAGTRRCARQALGGWYHRALIKGERAAPSATRSTTRWSTSGAICGPFLAGWIEHATAAQTVFFMVAASAFCDVLRRGGVFQGAATWRGAGSAESFGQLIRNFVTVLGNFRFLLFLLIFSGYWIVFWQQYLIHADLHSRLHRSKR